MDPRQAAIQKIALQCKTDLFFLCKYILNYDKMEEHTHQELCDYTTSILPNPPEELLPRIQAKHDDFDPRKNQLLLLMPRGTFKSSIVTIGFTLQMLLNEPNVRILIDSETFSKSKAFLREIIEHLVGNEAYREIYKSIHGVFPYTKKGDMKLWTDSELIVTARNVPKKEPTISCAGIDVTKNGMHYDLIICDDLHSETNVTNDEQLDHVKQHHKLLFSLLDPGRPLIVIGTRWHFNDLYQHILDNEQEDFNVLVKSVYNDDGSLLFPEVLNEAALDKIRRHQGSAVFSKQYLNQVISDEDAIFKRSQIVRKPLEEINGRPINWYLSVDPAYSDAKSVNTGDFTAMVLAGMDYQREIYVRYVLRKKMSYSELIDEIFRVYTDPKFRDIRNMKIVLETIGTKSLSYELSNEQRRRNTWLPVTEIRSRPNSKLERIKALSPFYEYGHIYHIKECPQLEEFETELLHFPYGKHDDIIDALATVLEVASPPNAKGWEKREERGVSKKRLLSYKPRSAITGV